MGVRGPGMRNTGMTPSSGAVARLTSRNHPYDRKDTLRDSGTPPTRRDSRAATLTGQQKMVTSRSLKPPNQDHERCRLVVYRTA